MGRFLAFVTFLFLTSYLTEPAFAGPVGFVKVYLVPQRVVCRGGTYSEENCAGQISDRAKLKRILQEAGNPVGTRIELQLGENLFPPLLVEKSKSVDFDKNEDSLLMDFEWNGAEPHDISIWRRDFLRGGALIFPKRGVNPYHRLLKDGFFYHFAFVQTYRLLMLIKTGKPDRSLSIAATSGAGR